MLGDASLTASEMTAKLGLHERSHLDFLDALVSLGFLDRDGVGPDARYSNTAETATFLDKQSPAYLGGMLEMANSRLSLHQTQCGSTSSMAPGRAGVGDSGVR